MHQLVFACCAAASGASTETLILDASRGLPEGPPPLHQNMSAFHLQNTCTECRRLAQHTGCLRTKIKNNKNMSQHLLKAALQKKPPIEIGSPTFSDPRSPRPISEPRSENHERGDSCRGRPASPGADHLRQDPGRDHPGRLHPQGRTLRRLQRREPPGENHEAMTIL